MTKHSPCSITIAHINDTHSYLEPSMIQLANSLSENASDNNLPYLSVGGFSRVQTRIKQLKLAAAEDERKFLFLHAGDCFQGTLYFSLFKGIAAADMLNRLEVDAMVIGNHELDLGNDLVAEFANEINFDLLAGNWDLSSERIDKLSRLSANPRVLSYIPKSKSAQYKIILASGEPIALFGITHNLMTDISNPDADTPFTDAVDTATATISEIRNNGINKIIVLSHLGYEGDRELAQCCEGISLIIGGHSHVLQGDFEWAGWPYHDEYGVEVNGTRIVQSGCHAMALGHCDIDFNADGSIARFSGKNELLLGRVLFKESEKCSERDKEFAALEKRIYQHPGVCVVEKDQELQRHLLDNYTYRVRQIEANKIAFLPRALRHVRIPDRTGGSEVAPLVAKSFRHTLAEIGMVTDFAIHNSGGVRCSMESGDITCADVSGKLLPYNIPIGRYKVSGKVLAQILEGAINNALNNSVTGTGEGSYPYCDGLRFDYVENNPVNKRITNLECYRNGVWELVKESMSYIGTSSLYTMKGKEGYDAIRQTLSPNEATNISMADAFIEWLKRSHYSIIQSN